MKDSPGRILVFRGKHGDTHYKAETVEDLHNAALKELEWRLDYYINDYGEFEKSWGYKHYGWADIPKSEEEISRTLHTDEERVAARQKLKRYLADKREHEAGNAFYQKAKKALEEQDGPLAWEIIDARDAHEYEGFSFEYLS